MKSELQNSLTPNRLINEKSPYLLQHAHNPVDWYPWSQEAFDKAKKQDKHIFLSIGYATCHWCHVMEHESFENQEIAKVMNEHFICIKVDREERPGIENIYMAAVQRMTGQGGWPMSVFLTPKGQPFFGGTYFPPTAKWGRPGFTEILNGLANAWEKDRPNIFRIAQELSEEIASQALTKPGQLGDHDTLIQAGQQFQQAYDPVHGGFSPQTKFPRPHSLQLLLRLWERTKEPHYLEMVENTLKKIAHGGIHDHLGGGFSRYSVDREWLVPHFEKMLYDQALLALAYLEAWQITGYELYAKTVHDIFTYVLRDMTDPQGGFYSAEDADSEGEEGKFYVWGYQEILSHLGQGIGEPFCAYYGVTETGNFEGHNILHRTQSLEDVAQSFDQDLKTLEKQLLKARQQLFEIRKQRIPPLKDDKVLTAWNGLMIAALAKGGRVLSEDKYIQAAEKAAHFILKNLQVEGRLLRRWREGDADLLGYVDDYTFMSFGLTELYFATGKTHWLQEALTLTEKTLELFWDTQDGGLHFSGHDGEKLITSFKEIYDGAVPSGNSVGALNFARLGHLTNNDKLKNYAQKILEVFAGHTTGQGMNYPQMLLALDFLLGPNQEIVIAGPPQNSVYQSFVEQINQKWLPRSIVIYHQESDSQINQMVPYIKEQTALDGQPTVYFCTNYSCQTPVTNLAALEKLLGSP